MSFDQWKAENQGILDALGIPDAPAKVLWCKGFLCVLTAWQEVANLILADIENHVRRGVSRLRRPIVTLERIIRFEPAWDKRSTDPKKNYGIHGVELLMLVRGEHGAVQFRLSTNWQLPQVAKEEEVYGKNVSYHPIPIDLGYHSYVPRYEGQESIDLKCECLGGKPCYYDGSTLNAERPWKLLVEQGSDAVWEFLEARYRVIFDAPQTKESYELR